MGNRQSFNGVVSFASQRFRQGTVSSTKENVMTTEKDKDKEILTYTVGGTPFELTVKRFVDYGWAYLSIGERNCEVTFMFIIELLTSPPDFLWISENMGSYKDVIPHYWTDDAPGGGFVETSVNLHETRDGNKQGLLVLERLKKGKYDEVANVLTVRHYLASDTNSTGVSVVAEIRVLNHNIDVDMEGPHKHPSHALFCMFSHVMQTRKWKPNMCSHCGDHDNEDRDSRPIAPHDHGNHQNAQVIENMGAFVGDGNGCYNKHEYYTKIERMYVLPSSSEDSHSQNAIIRRHRMFLPSDRTEDSDGVTSIANGNGRFKGTGKNFHG